MPNAGPKTIYLAVPENTDSQQFLTIVSPLFHQLDEEGFVVSLTESPKDDYLRSHRASQAEIDTARSELFEREVHKALAADLVICVTSCEQADQSTVEIAGRAVLADIPTFIYWPPDCSPGIGWYAINLHAITEHTLFRTVDEVVAAAKSQLESSPCPAANI